MKRIVRLFKSISLLYAFAGPQCEIGRFEITCNRAGRSIKPFIIIDRKNFMFTNTPKGATNSTIMFNLIQPAIENGLDHTDTWSGTEDGKQCRFGSTENSAEPAAMERSG